eukprot:11392-Heterococcus_DN1.PRE.1
MTLYTYCASSTSSLRGILSMLLASDGAARARAIAPDAQLHTAAASKANDAVNTDKQLDGALKELVAV